MNAKKAFTLIELLVVIAIIAILAAILFPVFAQAKAAAKKAVALSNQKQIGLANVMYAGDADDVLPLARAYGAYNIDMPALLGPYIQKVQTSFSNDTSINSSDNVWHDPADPTSARRKLSMVPVYWSYERAAFGPEMGNPNNDGGYIAGRAMTAFADPGGTFIMAETALTTALIGQNFSGVKRPWEPQTSTWPGNAGAATSAFYAGQDCVTRDANLNCTKLLDSTKPSGFHQDGWVYAYADGHAKYLKAIATIGKGVNGNGLADDGIKCGYSRPCGPWTLIDND